MLSSKNLNSFEYIPAFFDGFTCFGHASSVENEGDFFPFSFDLVGFFHLLKFCLIMYIFGDIFYSFSEVLE